MEFCNSDRNRDKADTHLDIWNLVEILPSMRNFLTHQKFQIDISNGVQMAKGSWIGVFSFFFFGKSNLAKSS